MQGQGRPAEDGGKPAEEGGKPAEDGGKPALPDGRPRPFFAPAPGEPPQAAPGQPQEGQQPGQPQPGQPGQSQSQPGQQPAPTYGQPSPASQLGTAPGLTQDQRPRQQAQRRPVRQQPPGRELKQRSIAAAVFSALSLVALLGLGTDLRKGIYVLLFSAVVGISGSVIGITALVKARRTGTLRPRWAVMGIVLGALAAFISIPIIATYLAFPTQVNNYVNCLQQAQNTTQQQSCMSKFYKSIRLSASAPSQLRAYGSAEGPPGRLDLAADFWPSAHRSR